MPYIIVENLRSKAINCKTNKEKLLDILLQEADWMHACGGKGKCTSCKAILVSGYKSLGKLTQAEERFAGMGRLAPDERLTCQVHIQDQDLVLRVPESTKLPHVNYSD